MTILITGGSSKTAIPLTTRLQSTKTPYLLTSRRESSSPTTVLFDWSKPATYNTILSSTKITGVYLVAPISATPADQMNPFITAAISHGVRRFVLLGGGSLTKDAPWLGEVWRHLDAAAKDSGVTYAVVRPSWFMENLVAPGWIEGIKNESVLYSGCKEATFPLTSAFDIAGVAAHALTAPADQVQETYDVKGPERISFGEVAKKIGNATGREIKHVHLEPKENTERFLKAGNPEMVSGLLASLEERTANGQLEYTFALEPNDAKKVLGDLVHFDSFVEENKGAWM